MCIFIVPPILVGMGGFPIAGSFGTGKEPDKKLLDAIEQKERELAKIVQYKHAIYQDWKDGEISHSDYRSTSPCQSKDLAVGEVF